ncbi:unnamed protein product [Ceutorhynchus assimilis]|uniref:Uncharacterized protein n=1 Tax=Ceutorhynchus assimilis TaxID=467358 RepID=A0A9N9MR10_9CUCU|nr:unnamed protein product [Ceutorhynchus assimilis]
MARKILISQSVTMLSKITVLFFVAHAASAFHLTGPQEQLQIIMKEIKRDVPVDINEALISIRANLAPLSYYTDNAKTRIAITDLKVDAQPFWTKIAELDEQAKKVGRLGCIEEGMELFFDLNNTAIAKPFRKINNYYNKGYLIVFKSDDKIDAVSKTLKDLTTRADNCAEDECASVLVKEAISFYSSSYEDIKAAIADITQYAQVDLLKILATIQIDKESYVSGYNGILERVKLCID